MSSRTVNEPAKARRKARRAKAKLDALITEQAEAWRKALHKANQAKLDAAHAAEGTAHTPLNRPVIKKKKLPKPLLSGKATHEVRYKRYESNKSFNDRTHWNDRGLV